MSALIVTRDGRRELLVLGDVVPLPRDGPEARGFLAWCCSRLGLGFHPDTPFRDYVGADGRAVFTPTEAAILEVGIGAAFDHLDDVYSECMKLPPFADATGG